jgi:hypothetical protein
MQHTYKQKYIRHKIKEKLKLDLGRIQRKLQIMSILYELNLACYELAIDCSISDADLKNSGWK